MASSFKVRGPKAGAITGGTKQQAVSPSNTQPFIRDQVRRRAVLPDLVGQFRVAETAGVRS
jgi:hypothetical protein